LLGLLACEQLNTPTPKDQTGDDPALNNRAVEYALSLSKGGAALGEHVFPAAYPGYGDIAALELTVGNAGPEAAENVALSLSGEGAASFSLSAETIGRIEAGSSATFTARPVPELAGGIYQAIVTVRDGNGRTLSVELSFTVSLTPLYGIALDLADYAFPPRGVDYLVQEPLTVTVRNIGNEPTGPLSITLDGDGAGSFAAEPAEIAGVPAGETASFAVRPANGLGAGLYTTTVTVSGDHAVTAVFTASFRVVEGLVEIAAAEDLARIGVDFPADGNYVLVSSLTLDNWTPLTDKRDAPFTGVFNGGGHAITINSFAAEALRTGPEPGYANLEGHESSIGVFGCVKGARVENLTVELNMPNEQEIYAYDKEKYPDPTQISYAYNQHIGGVSGYAEDTEFEGVTVSGDINLVKTDGRTIYLGGVTGYLDGGGIRRAEGSANLTAQEPWPKSNGHSSVHAGGLAGRVERGEIAESRVSGAINVYSRRSSANAGGATGSVSSGRLYKIAASGAVEAGVSKFMASMTTYGNAARAGGIVGGVSGDGSEIRECYSTGDVTSITYAPGAGGNQIYAGGIVGEASGEAGSESPILVTDCYSRGNIAAKTDPGFYGENAKFYAGGIAGLVSNTTVQNSYATGIITAESTMAASTYPRAGGIAAVLEGYADRTITVRGCAALSPQINWSRFSKDDNILRRVASLERFIGSVYQKQGKEGLERYPENTTISNNIANRDMEINYEPSDQQREKVQEITIDPGANTKDGADCDPKPAQSVFEGLGWNFATVWRMGGDGYPALQWQ
jgi:hypothetical protein